MGILLTGLSRIFDFINELWEENVTRQFLGIVLVVVYLVSLVLIDLNMRDILPRSLGEFIPRNHLHAISIAFTLLLIIEVIELILGIAQSVSRSVGKQFEIFSLILLRQSFKEFSLYHEPLKWTEVSASVLPIISDASGALFIFIGLVFYYRSIKNHLFTVDADEQSNFIIAKKIVSLLLLSIFVYIIVYNGCLFAMGTETLDIFNLFYTILIFSDILIVLIATRYTHTYMVVFRNTGFALATVLIRIALTAPPYYDAALGSGVMLFILGIVTAYNRLTPEVYPGNGEHSA